MKSCLYCGLQSDHEAPLEHRRQLNIAIVLIHVKAKHEDNITHIALIVLMHSAAQLWKNHDTKELRRKKEEKLRDLEHISNQFMSFFFFFNEKIQLDGGSSCWDAETQRDETMQLGDNHQLIESLRLEKAKII